MRDGTFHDAFKNKLSLAAQTGVPECVKDYANADTVLGRIEPILVDSSKPVMPGMLTSTRAGRPSVSS